MITGFYLTLFAFIFAEIYHYFNKNRLDLIFKNKNVESIKKLDVVFYMMKLLSIFWPLIGLFSSFSEIFMLIVVVNLIKFLFYHLNEKIYKFYINSLPWINVLIYLVIIFCKFIY